MATRLATTSSQGMNASFGFWARASTAADLTELDEVVAATESDVDEAEGCEFPGMYG